RPGQFNFRKCEHRVPKRKGTPAAFAVTPRTEMLNALLQSFLLAIEPANEQMTPKSDRALSATKDSNVGLAWIRRCAGQALEQTISRAVQGMPDVLVRHVELAECATCFFAQNVAGRSRVDALAAKQSDSALPL